MHIKELPLKNPPLALNQNHIKTLNPNNIQIDEIIGVKKGYVTTRDPEKKGVSPIAAHWTELYIPNISP